MLFAQTGTNPILPKTPLEAEVNPYLIALWWLVPLVIAAIWIALTVRSNKIKSDRRQRINAMDASKSKELKKSSPPNEEAFSISASTPSSTSNVPPKTGLNTSKKEKNKRKQKAKPPVSAAEAPTLVVPPEKISALHATETQASTASPAEPKPSNAIFEPLRDASKGRRKAFADATFDNRDAREESVSRENDAYNQLFGGKFERIIPKQSLRSVASRWPAPEPEQPKTSAPVVARTPQSVKTIVPETIAETRLETPGPAQGLKSFVSKVKSVPADAELPSDETPTTPQHENEQ